MPTQKNGWDGKKLYRIPRLWENGFPLLHTNNTGLHFLNFEKLFSVDSWFFVLWVLKYKGSHRFFQITSKIMQRILAFFQTMYFKNQILSETPKTRHKRSPRLFQITSKTRYKKTSRCSCTLLQERNKGPPRDSFKLLRRRKKGVLEILLNYFKNKTRNPQDSFKLLQEQNKRGPPDSFKLLEKQDKGSPRFF